nr:MAG TPA: hypothetical protein [Caudoviricetes sp.]
MTFRPKWCIIKLQRLGLDSFPPRFFIYNLVIEFYES